MCYPKILLFDIDPEFIYLINRYCEASGCRVTHIDSLERVLSQLESDPPDALMVNMMLVAGNSRQFFLLVRRNPALEKAPIIFYTSLQDEPMNRSFGADYYLWKPILFDDFILALQATGLKPRPAGERDTTK